MLIYVLITILLIMLITSFVYFNNDIIHPAVVFCLMFVFSVLSAIYNIDTWHLNMRMETFLILVGMAIVFLLTSYVMSKLYTRNSNESELFITNVKVSNLKILLISIFDLVYLYFLVINIIDIASSFGDPQNFSEVLTLYKANVIYKANASLPKYITFPSKFVLVFAYIFMYLGINNIVSDKQKYVRIARNLKYFVPTVLYCISLLLQSSRGSILRVVIAGFVIWLILFYKKNSYIIKFSYKRLSVIIMISALALSGFYYASSLVGRDTLNKNLVEYVTMYGGGSIEGLDLYIQDKPQKSELFGRETFWGTWRFLIDYGIVDYPTKPTGSLEWRKVDGVTIGNVYTAYRRWIQDFGIIGCVIMTAIVSWFYNWFYYKLLYHKIRNKNVFNILLIIYSMFFYHLFLISIDCRIFDEIIPASIVQYMVLVISYYIIVGDIRVNKMLKVRENG